MKKNILLNDNQVEIDIESSTATDITFIYKEKKYSFYKNQVEAKVVSSAPSFVVKGKEMRVEVKSNLRAKKAHADHGQMVSPMPGKILKILISEGSIITAGTPILVMEAMKMEHTVKASKDGTITKIHFSEGAQVNAGVELVSIC